LEIYKNVLSKNIIQGSRLSLPTGGRFSFRHASVSGTCDAMRLVERYPPVKSDDGDMADLR
jgi:hypothetical protein